MQIRYDSTAGLANVGYRILNADKTEYAALTTTGVTEVSPGGYGVTVADDVLAGRTVEWYEGATYSVAESFPAGVAQSGDAFARLGAPTGASIAADIANLTGVVTEGVPHIYAPTSATRVIGDDEGGTVENLAAADDTYFVTGEVVGTGLEVIVTLATSTVGDIPAGVELFGRYSGGSGHLIYVYQYDYQAGAWETNPGITMSNRTGDFAYVVGATAVNHNPTTGEMKLRLVHSVGTYNASHALYLNRVAWTKVEASDPSAVQIAAILSLVSAFDTVDFPAVQGVVDTLAARLTATRAGNLDRLDATITSRLASASYTTPPTASENADAWVAAQTVNGLVEDDAGSLRFTANALEEAPTGGAGSDPLMNPVPGTYPIGSAGRILGSIDPRRVTFLSPVTDDNNFTIYRGAAYTTDLGTQLEFTNVPEPTVADPAVSVVIEDVLYPAQYAAGVVTLELTSAETALLDFSVAPFSCIIVEGDETIVLFEGTATIRDFQHAAGPENLIPTIYQGASYTASMGTAITFGPYTFEAGWVVTVVIDGAEYDTTVDGEIATLELTGNETDEMVVGTHDLFLKVTEPGGEYAILYATTVDVREAITR